MPLAQLKQEDGGHDDKEKEPASHELQKLTFEIPAAVPEGQGKQAAVPSVYVPAAHAAEQEEDPAVECVPALHAMQVVLVPLDLEKVPAGQGVQSLLVW